MELLRQLYVRPGLGSHLVATAVYLAETEDSPALSAEIIQRAAAIDIVEHEESGQGRPANRRGMAAAAVVAACLVVPIAGGERSPSPSPVVPQVSMRRVTMPAAAPATVVDWPVPMQPLDEIFVSDPPLPPGARMEPAPAASPPGPFVRIFFDPHRTSAATYTDSIARRLHAAGFPTELGPLAKTSGRSLSIRYFHWQDFDLAKRVADTIGADKPPRLYRAPRGSRTSGLVEIVVP